MSIYTENGYKSRKHYLAELALDMELPAETVFSIAGLLGSNEDFDGLVTELEDYAEGLCK